MKKYVFTLIILLAFTGVTALAQVGFGISSHGFSIRTDPDDRNGLLLRSGFGYSFSHHYTKVSPEIAWIRRCDLGHRSQIYAGVGLKSRIEVDYDDVDITTGLFIPVGLEIYPIRNRDHFSVSIESGLRSQRLDPDDWHHHRIFDRYGLLEVTFYLGRD